MTGARLGAIAVLAVSLLLDLPSARGGTPLAYGSVIATTPYPGVVDICAKGTVDDGTTLVGWWIYTVAGTNSDDDTFVAILPASAAEPSFPKSCQYVYLETAAGELVANLTFVGVGTADVAGAWGVSVTWSESTGTTLTHYYTNR